MFKKKPFDLDPRILKRLFKRENDVQVMVYWEDNYEVLVELLLLEEDKHIVQKALLLLSRSLNNREKYTWTAFIYHKVFVPKKRLQGEVSSMVNEIKFELGKGLHFTREYSESKRLFDDLNRVPNFDHSQYADWYEHTLVSSKREQYLDSNSFLLPLSKLLFSLIYLVLIVSGFYPIYTTGAFLGLVLFLQFSHYWDKAASHFGTFKKHKEEVQALKLWMYLEGFLVVLFTSSIFYFWGFGLKAALAFVGLLWLGSLLFNILYLTRLRARITNPISSEST